jgi:Zn-dependent protease with chaperone function
VTAAQAPALHALVEQLRRQIEAPGPNRIVVSRYFNASAVQLPRAGIFWPRNILAIGYPLFATLSPDQLRAVISHELAHLSRAHGRFFTWIYRTRLSWLRLMDSLHARCATPAHAYWLYRWYVPRLQTRSAAISRQQEMLADNCAAWIAGGRTTAEALVALDIGATLFDRTFWQDVFAGVERAPEPPRPFSTLAPHLWDVIAADANGLMAQALQRVTDPADTHAALGDRLRALGEEASLPMPCKPTAGDVYLGPHMAVIAAALDADWHATHAVEWRREHAERRKGRQRLADLAGLAAATPEELFERGQLSERFEDATRAFPHYCAASDRGHTPAMLAAGRILLERNDEAGVALIERAMDGNPALVSEGCDRLVQFFRNRNRLTDVHRYLVRSTRQATRAELAETERKQVSAVDRFSPHRLPAAELSALFARLTRESDVLQAFLATKELRYSTGAQLVLALVAKGQAAQELPEQIRAEAVLPQNAAILVLKRHDRPLRAALDAVPGARVYARGAVAHQS